MFCSCDGFPDLELHPSLDLRRAVRVSVHVYREGLLWKVELTTSVCVCAWSGDDAKWGTKERRTERV